jgi:outer membrane receptor protein involved in Fe transport
MAWTIGLSVDSFSSPIVNQNKINPKIGLNWHILPSTTLRAAWFRTVKRPFASNQTIEPTQVSGFNQFFDDIDGTKMERYGFAFDQRLSSALFGGLEVSWRDLETPIFNETTSTTLFEDQKEQLHRAYLYWTPMDSLALNVEYFVEDIEKIRGGAKETITTHRVPIQVSYYQPKGFLARFGATYVDQNVSTSSARGDDQFWVLDASVGYRLPKRWGIAQVGMKNLLNENFRFHDINFNTGEPLIPLFQPERIVFAQFTLSF